MRGRLLVLLLVLVLFPLRAQQYFFRQFSVAEGLAQSTVYALLQDQHEVYWLGTQAGVSRFAGSEFENFSSSDGLSENGVRALCEDGHNQLWFGHTGGGVSRYRDLAFESIPLLDSLLPSTITSIVEDGNGQLWITSQNHGVIRIENPESPASELKARSYSAGEISDRVFGATLAPGGKLYFVADPNVKVWDPVSDTTSNLQLKGIPAYYSSTCILVDSRGDSWVGKYNGGLYWHELSRGESTMFDLIEAGMSSNWVSTLFEDSRGSVWVGTWGGGLARISMDGQIRAYTRENGLPGMKVWSIAEDHEGNILVGTNENGLCVFRGEQFISYLEEDGLRNPQVWSAMERQNGQVWLGTNDGISILQNGQMSSYEDLQGDRILFLEEDHSGTVWIGARGVFSYDGRGQVFDPQINKHIVDLQVTAMEVDRYNNLWVGTLEGLVYYEIDTRKSTRLSQIHGLPGNEISTLFADSSGSVWVGSAGKGISVIRGDSIRAIDLGFDFTPRCFVTDQEGMLWIGTEGRGVLHFDPENEELLEDMTVKDGLLANLINQLNIDRYNNLYIGTNKGLNTLMRKDGMIYAFTAGSGFVGIETKPNATLTDREGRLWFGTVNGITRFTPRSTGFSGKEPSVHITGVEVEHEAIPLGDGQRFPHKRNSFHFEYRCITMNPDALLYQIMLEGVDAEWRDPETGNSVTYPALRHGKYRFLVKARSSEGVWTTEPVGFSFEIRPPIYLTWWFILSAIFALMGAILAYVKIRERALKQENIVLEEKVKDRTATVVAQKEELARKNKDITDSIRYAKRIQFAILPEDPPYPDTFVLFKPKDIVSGDFYWFEQAEGREYMAAVDCTGHGVPGAFMSIIGHNSLNKIVKEYGILEPGKILTRLNQEVMATLHKRSDGGEVLDGMDLALVCFKPGEKALEYSGAFNSLYLARAGELSEVKAHKVSIGRSSVRQESEYPTQCMDIQKGDSIYLFSDGYADQFGGPDMKKFKYRQLKELILEISDKPMPEQQRILDQRIEDWKGEQAQLDDILVVGRRF